jgi:hypothetical protein
MAAKYGKLRNILIPLEGRYSILSLPFILPPQILNTNISMGLPSFYVARDGTISSFKLRNSMVILFRASAWKLFILP